MRFLIDQMFPRDLTELFIARGHEAKSVSRLGLRGATDEAIWSIAEESEWVVVSHDSDFVAMARTARRAQLVHYRGGNRTKDELIARFAEKLPEIVAALESGEKYVEFS